MEFAYLPMESTDQQFHIVRCILKKKKKLVFLQNTFRSKA